MTCCDGNIGRKPVGNSDPAVHSKHFNITLYKYFFYIAKLPKHNFWMEWISLQPPIIVFTFYKEKTDWDKFRDHSGDAAHPACSKRKGVQPRLAK